MDKTGIGQAIDALTCAMSLSDHMTLGAANAQGYVTVAQYHEASGSRISIQNTNKAMLTLYRAGKAERVRVGNAYAYRLKP